MNKNITFSVSTNRGESQVEQIFTFKELNLDSILSKEKFEEKIQELFKIWVWDQLSYSIVIDHSNSSDDD